MTDMDAERPSEGSDRFDWTRRRMLTGAGVALIGSVAGCSSGGDGEDGGGDGNGDGGGSDGSDGSGDGGESSSSPDLVIVDSEMGTRDYSYDDTLTYADFQVENQGDARSGRSRVTADWFDADGNKIVDSSTAINTIGAGVTWDSRTEPKSKPDTEIDSYELSVEMEEEFEQLSEVTVTDTNLEQMEDGDDEYVNLRAEAEYTGSEEYDYVTAVANLLDADGRIVDNGAQDASSVGPGDSWTFEIGFFVNEPKHAEGEDVEIFFEGDNL